ncbi:hypothetical protein TTHERM_000294949 (macronuclear) [Tetrahymena thermophila SB210]|uniref:Uncharacterized protein n=1 Tax=Tetrahymena thermophila (strain SB210) TaxID=312017 RepID=W7XEJ9_TETTS|nr:hypothetical protein TTHERM_000294949 [Tetrahymena thermophila SB210]EWS75118.1 hypothetical protein TTHERM_000294949 [Tetrahymena thermophila SB210]|eukprot:XP_012652356.1 hypothetical protein TTHERM_000294949 [Tetrahymena thermophila SB210]
MTLFKSFRFVWIIRDCQHIQKLGEYYYKIYRIIFINFSGQIKIENITAFWFFAYQLLFCMQRLSNNCQL